MGLSELLVLRTGPKIAYNIAYTLKKASAEYDVVEAIRVPMFARYEKETEQVEKEWAELMARQIEFEARPVAMSDLEQCVDADKITGALLLKLGDFICN